VVRIGGFVVGFVVIVMGLWGVGFVVSSALLLTLSRQMLVHKVEFKG
jgi:hypothetical protein